MRRFFLSLDNSSNTSPSISLRNRLVTGQIRKRIFLAFPLKKWKGLHSKFRKRPTEGGVAPAHLRNKVSPQIKEGDEDVVYKVFSFLIDPQAASNCEETFQILFLSNFHF
ncbi:unnamed protein product [Larinioides sclopetarius]|uniref:Uncharacterized protein n=1 Tax=Larinioides sclopetarius TaxID=280406 RepID=A0AAV2BI72_9ARAC